MIPMISGDFHVFQYYAKNYDKIPKKKFLKKVTFKIMKMLETVSSMDAKFSYILISLGTQFTYFHCSTW